MLVAAPTGSGKTVVAEYAVGLALHEGRRAFYTTPLKALSNQKFGDLQERLGADRVGLLTGDNAVRGAADAVVMTTEVLRNMIYEDPGSLDDLGVVVLDEVHYLQDRARGAVWEEVIVHLPAHVRLVSLSATVSNAEEVADWIQTVRGETTVVIEERRPVELVHLYAAHDRANEELVVLPTFVAAGGDLVPNAQASRLDRGGAGSGRRRGRYATPWRVDVLDHLATHDLLPAIFFVFSRAGCDDAVEQVTSASVRLTDADEQRRLRAIAQRHVEGLTDADLAALEYDHWLAALEQGVAAHHAGIVPPMKEAVEEAFAAGLAKVVFATETLALGVNMPARTVVIERLSKFTGERHELLTAGEYTQLTGRAGRRGIDEIGYALVYWSPFVTFDQVAALASRRTYPLRSSFRPDYNMAANLVRRYDEPRAHHLLSLSFAQYHADRDVVVVERRLEREQAALARRRADAAAGPGDLTEYRRLVAAYDDALREHRDATGPHNLRPGDVLRAPRYGPVVVLRPGTAGGRVMVLTRDERTVRLARRDLAGSRRSGHIALPRPFRPNHPEFRRVVAEKLRTAAPSPVEGDDTGTTADDDLAALRQLVATHPAAADPRLARRLEAAREADRLEQRVAKLERRLSGRSDSLARQLDRVLEVLHAWGYVEGWALTPAGELLARIYSESDLLVAESVREGLLDGLTPEELAALVSVFTYQRRGPEGDEPMPPRTWPSGTLRARVRSIEEIGRDLTLVERDARLPPTPPPDPGLVAGLHAWASGADLATVLDAEEMTGGDFVRNVKQVVDLLHQLAEHAPDPHTARTAARAADACLRGVVAASTYLT